jgi:hypothetical protein
MAPEQAEGKRVDARSDIFSFGSVLYEMVTGRRAFSGETRISTLSAILHKEPPPLEDAPPELGRIIARCLRKDPARRTQQLRADFLGAAYPEWAPDGQHVLFLGTREAACWSFPLVLATARISGGSASRPGLGNTEDHRLFLIDVASRRRIELLAIKGRWFAGRRFSKDQRWMWFSEGTSVPRMLRAPFQGETMAPESTWSAFPEFSAYDSAWSPDETLSYDISNRDGFHCVWAQRVDPLTKRPVGPPNPVCRYTSRTCAGWRRTSTRVFLHQRTGPRYLSSHACVALMYSFFGGM